MPARTKPQPDEGSPHACASCGHPPTPSRPVLPFLAADGVVTLALPWCDQPREIQVPKVAGWLRLPTYSGFGCSG